MNNTILKSLGIKNFASFADGAEFTTMQRQERRKILETSLSRGILHLIRFPFSMEQMDRGKPFSARFYVKFKESWIGHL